MSRRRYLVAYDVAEDRRRNRVFKTLSGVGDWVQYSVFVCELNRREHVEVSAALAQHVNNAEDQVLFIDLGPAEQDSGRLVSSLGRPYEPPTRVVVI